MQKEEKVNLGAKKFAMWLFIFTSMMFFAAMTSAFIVYSGGKNHALNMILPQAFKYSTTVIIISSITLFLASRAAKQSQVEKQRMFLWITVLLGIAFFALQIYAWYVMTYQMGVHFAFNSNASQSFVYVFSGMHLLHIIAALILLLNTTGSTYKQIPQARNLFKMEITSIFWHFLDIIWIFLYVFLLLNQH